MTSAERSSRVEAPHPGASPIGAVLLRALSIVRRDQLATGEIAAYYRRTGRTLTYVRSLLPATVVHDALGWFDPTSVSVDTAVFDLIPSASRLRFLRAVVEMRAHIRGFLAWEEGCHGDWRYFGRAGGVAADADTTASAAVALLDGRRQAVAGQWQRHVKALERLAPAAGSTGDLAAEANVLRLLALVGEEVSGRVDAVLAAVAGGAADPDRDPRRWLAAYCVLRAWSSAHLPRRDELRGLLRPLVMRHAESERGFGGPVSTALGLSLLLDLELAGAPVERACASLLDTTWGLRRFACEPFLRDDGCSIACSFALAMPALARASLHQPAPK